MARRPKFGLEEFFAGQMAEQEAEEAALKPVLWIPDRDDEDPEVEQSKKRRSRTAARRQDQPGKQPAVQKSVQPHPQPAARKPEQPSAQPAVQKPAQSHPQPVARKPEQPSAQPVTRKPEHPSAQPVARKPEQPSAQPAVQKPAQPQPAARKPEQPSAQPAVQKPEQSHPQPTVQKPVQPQSTVWEQEQLRSQPKQKLGKRILAILLGVLVIPLSSYVTVHLMGGIYRNVGRPRPTVQQKLADMQIFEQFDDSVSGRIRAVRNSMLPPVREEDTEVSTPPEETVPPVRKQYWIEEGTLVAPEPNQSLFGRTDDPKVLEQVLQDAQWLLDGQTTYFQPDQKLYEDSIVRYYLDDSIFAVTWQEVHDGSVYTFSEVKVSHPSQFRRHLAGGEYGSDMQYLTTEMAASVNAVVASAGDFYRFRDFGAVVYQGEAKRVEGTYAETCYIDAKGDLHFTYGGDVLTVEDVQKFVDERDIQFSLAFGPILVDNYEVVPHTWYGVGEITEEYARAALLQMDTLHYIVVTANTTGNYQQIPTVEQFGKNIAATGCRMAYCLDGGQTATIVMNDELVNRPVYGQQRKISDIIYFATAVPEGGAENG